MIPNISNIISRLEQFIQKSTTHKAGTLLLSVAIYLIFSSIYFPEAIFKKLNGSFTQNEIYIQDFVNKKIEDPFLATKNKDEGDHFMKRELRISPYLLGKFFHLNAVKLFYLQSLALIAFIGLFFSTVKKIMGNDASIAFWSVVAILFTYVGTSFNFDTLFYDSFAYLGLMFAIYYFDHKVSILFLAFSFFVDERAVIPAFILPIYFVLNQYRYFEIPQGFMELVKILTFKNKSFYFLTISLLIYVTGRIIFFYQFELRTPIGTNTGVSIGFALRHGLDMFLALFYALKFYILFPILCFYGLIQKKLPWISFFYFLIFLACLVISTSVDDVTRSMSFSYILLFVAFQLIDQFQEKVKAKTILYLITLTHILTPTHTLLLSLIPIEAWHWLKLF